jgi:hypothetical protein
MLRRFRRAIGMDIGAPGFLLGGERSGEKGRGQSQCRAACTGHARYFLVYYGFAPDFATKGGAPQRSGR